MKTYAEIKKYVQKIADIDSASAVLSWDKEVNLPTGGAEARTRQLATLASISHERTINPSLIENIDRLIQQNDLNEEKQISLKRLQRDIRMQLKFSSEFVEKLSQKTSAAYHTWIEARKKSDFSHYAGALDELIIMKREAADILGYNHHPYDALLDQYEPEMTVKILDRVFNQLKQGLLPLLNYYMSRPPIDDSFLKDFYNEKDQWDFGIQVLRQMGYNFSCGRQDKSPHPFTISFATSDVRVTTRVDEHNYAYMLWSTIHEGGHALYEQGLNPDEYGMPLGEAASLSIHESQSRLWENHVGRSLNFWQYFFPKLQKIFPRQLKDITVDHFYQAINKISPNLIRTEADELHYHLHVLVRYEIEKLILSGEVKTKDLPTVWNELYHSYLNIEVPNDADGILQDVHWAFGGFGYFPTYSLGSFYAAQFYAKAEIDIPNLNEDIASGNMKPLHTWLKTNIYQHGKRYFSEELCKTITGKELDLTYFLQYVQNKFGHPEK